jgi:hypothetical protein
MAAGVVHIQWYATVGRGDLLAEQVTAVTPLCLRYGATQYQVHRSLDDRYKILQIMWFETKRDWYRYWEGPEAIEFRRRNIGKYQVPIQYIWHDELATGSMGPEVPTAEREPEPEPQPEAAA